MNKRLTRMTFLTAIFALMAIVLYSPISQITVSIFTITFLHLFVLIGIYLFDDWKEALALGLFFGLLSFTFAYQFPSAGRAPFQNPMISILPRILFGIISYGLFSIIKSMDKNKNHIYVGVWAAVSTVIHTALVLTAMSMFNTPIPFNVLGAIIVANMFPEVALAFFVVPFVALEVKKYILK